MAALHGEMVCSWAAGSSIRTAFGIGGHGPEEPKDRLNSEMLFTQQNDDRAGTQGIFGTV